MAIKLEDAVAVVQKEIRKWREKYESVANENGQDHPIMVEGEIFKLPSGYWYWFAGFYFLEWVAFCHDTSFRLEVRP